MDTPVFEPTLLEILGQSVVDLLAGRSPSHPLSPEHRRQAEALVQAYRQGNKVKVHLLAAAQFAEVIPPALCQRAYAQLAAMNVTETTEYRLIMDSFKHRYGQPAAAATPALSLDEALSVLLLDLTHSERNAISYQRIDAATGKFRPTTFPLTEALLQQFLAPFGDKTALLRRLVIFSRGMVLGLPAARLAQRYRQRKAHFEQLQTRQNQSQGSQAVASKPLNQPPAEIRLICQELAQLLEGAHDAQEKAALHHSLQPEQLHQLLDQNQNATGDSQTRARDFRQLLENLYATRLSRAQASYLSARLSSRMKRTLETMGQWKESYWSDFQTTMIQQGVWEGTEWLEKWRAGKKGKQALKRSGEDCLAPDKPVTVNELLRHSERMQDKLRGQQMLAVEPVIWQRPVQTRTTPEKRKLLLILSRPDRLNELLQHSFDPAFWETVPAMLRKRLFEGFTLLGDTDFDAIKTQYLESAEAEHRDIARQLITTLELKFNQISSMFRQDLGMTFSHALEILAARQREIAQRDKLNSPSWQNSPASHYSRYRQA